MIQFKEDVKKTNKQEYWLQPDIVEIMWEWGLENTGLYLPSPSDPMCAQKLPSSAQSRELSRSSEWLKHCGQRPSDPLWVITRYFVSCPLTHPKTEAGFLKTAQ